MRQGPLRSPRICRARLPVRVEALSSRRYRSRYEGDRHTSALEYSLLDWGPNTGRQWKAEEMWLTDLFCRGI